MPLYRYLCGRCGDWREDLRAIADRHSAPPCSQCGGELVLDLSAGFSVGGTTSEAPEKSLPPSRSVYGVRGQVGSLIMEDCSFSGADTAFQLHDSSIDLRRVTLRNNRIDFDLRDTHAVATDLDAD
jgi:putative FmdB family regulatory protein